MADSKALTIDEINAHIKAAIKSEFGADVGFKHIDSETALSYITQVVLQRIKQRTRGKEEREEMKRIKMELQKRGIKI